MTKKRTTMFSLETSKGSQGTFKFDFYSDNPTVGRDLAYKAAVKAKDGWMRNAPQYVPESGITIVEK